ncbi:hypothetical protein G6F22_016635 [Rhizopus arrhizus]|nr:hypothetical protein G6F22_016635 [Rhizopus arrhizus]
MFKPIPVAIGLRYLRAKRRNGFISFISMASILGIALGVTVLITTLAVMSGFQKEIRSRLLQMTAHTTISRDGEPMPDWMRVVDIASKDPRWPARPGRDHPGHRPGAGAEGVGDRQEGHQGQL